MKRETSVPKNEGQERVIINKEGVLAHKGVRIAVMEAGSWKKGGG